MSGVRRCQIVILEDNQADVQLLREALQENRVECTLDSFEDGDRILAALRRAAEEKRVPDLIVLDLNLPRMEGLDCLDSIRQMPEFHATPVVILTSSGFTQDRVSAAVSGADEYIQKPVSYEGYLHEVGPAIKAMLGGRKAA